MRVCQKKTFQRRLFKSLLNNYGVGRNCDVTTNKVWNRLFQMSGKGVFHLFWWLDFINYYEIVKKIGWPNCHYSSNWIYRKNEMCLLFFFYSSLLRFVILLFFRMKESLVKITVWILLYIDSCGRSIFIVRRKRFKNFNT